jgi:glucose-1-phosphate cytidylyltransferase
LEGEEMFFANYSDGLTDLPLPAHVDHFVHHGKVGSFVCVTPRLSYHLVSLSERGDIKHIQDMNRSSLRINGGFFVFRKDIFRYIEPGEELVHEPFQRLIKEQQLTGYKYDGFWASMDTFKDKQALDDMYARGNAPWELWKNKTNT